ncbi:MurR/RpiR family transcriptional regulator [Paradesulfitobacterium ferrireducens]|uniref:MurR/RpiR family transcriptional regulator n=1 Tax=Paradesulfitobacterium ferrireducens TaxID=2816476 RepID=UPI002E2A0805|nr:MurR/RpiR family transcriptional regulator [Paradesulfitobacterium ferrireducens]
MEPQISVLHRISQLYGQMSASHQALADVIIKDPQEAAFYNVGELARTAGVSESTVTRFAVFLGYSGFPALSRELQEIVRSKLSTGERFRLSRKVQNDEDRAAVSFFEEDLQNILMTIERIDLESYKRTVNSLLAARRVGIACARSSVSLGLFLEFYLNLLNKDVILFTGEPRTLDLLERFGPEDVVIGISFARYTQFTVKCLTYAKKKGAKIVALTDYPSSPLAVQADEVLLTPTGIASHMDSFAAPLSVITALLRSMAYKVPEQVAQALNDQEDIWTGFDVYVHPNK